MRKQAGLSQAALAEAIGIPERTISFYEREGGHIPSTLPQLAKALGVSLKDLLGDGAQRAKRGPKSQLERQLEAIATPPRSGLVAARRSSQYSWLQLKIVIMSRYLVGYFSNCGRRVFSEG